MSYIIKLLKYLIYFMLIISCMLTFGFVVDRGEIGFGIVIFFIICDILLILALVKIYNIRGNKKSKASFNEFSNKNYDIMEGLEFEHFCAEVLKRNGFSKVVVTQGSGDYGVDIVAVKESNKYAIQCKRYSSNVGNRAVQEAFSGKEVYSCDVGVVLTNQYFTKSAIETAAKTKVLLWDRDKLNKMLKKCIYQRREVFEKDIKVKRVIPQENIILNAGLLFIQENSVSIGLLMRKLKIGFNSANQIVNELEKIGLVGEEKGVHPREIVMSEELFRKSIKEQESKIKK